MTIRAYITKGPHIIGAKESSSAFGEYVFDLEINPMISLPESVLYTQHIPDELQKVINHFSINEVFEVSPHRTQGVYHFKDAKAILELNCGNKNSKYNIEANGETLANVVELCRRIRAGTILPTISYENDQVKSTVVLGIKESIRRLIDAIALVFNQWLIRLHLRVAK